MELPFILLQRLAKHRTSGGIGDVEHEVALRILHTAHLLHLAVDHNMASELPQGLFLLAEYQRAKARPGHYRFRPPPFTRDSVDKRLQSLQ